MGECFPQILLGLVSSKPHYGRTYARTDCLIRLRRPIVRRGSGSRHDSIIPPMTSGAGGAKAPPVVQIIPPAAGGGAMAASTNVAQPVASGGRVAEVARRGAASAGAAPPTASLGGAVVEDASASPAELIAGAGGQAVPRVVAESVGQGIAAGAGRPSIYRF